MKFVILVLISTVLFGCQTINLNNGNSSGTHDTQDFHHIGALQLVEFSPPVDLSEKCKDGNWQSVQTRRGPLQVLVSMAVGWAYSPHEVSVACKGNVN